MAAATGSACGARARGTQCARFGISGRGDHWFESGGEFERGQRRAQRCQVEYRKAAPAKHLSIIGQPPGHRSLGAGAM